MYQTHDQGLLSRFEVHGAPALQVKQVANFNYLLPNKLLPYCKRSTAPNRLS